MCRAYGDGSVHHLLASGRFCQEGLSIEALEEIKKIAGSEWPSVRSNAGLIAFCRQKFSEIAPAPEQTPEPPPAGGSGGQSATSDLRLQMWAMLRQSPGPTDLETIEALTELCIQAFETGTTKEKSIASSVWPKQCSRSERIDSDLIEHLFVEKNPDLVRLAEHWYLNRGDVERAAQVLLKIDESKRSDYWGSALLRASPDHQVGPHESEFLMV